MDLVFSLGLYTLFNVFSRYKKNNSKSLITLFTTHWILRNYQWNVMKLEQKLIHDQEIAQHLILIFFYVLLINWYFNVQQYTNFKHHKFVEPFTKFQISEVKYKKACYIFWEYNDTIFQMRYIYLFMICWFPFNFSHQWLRMKWEIGWNL